MATRRAWQCPACGRVEVIPLTETRPGWMTENHASWWVREHKIEDEHYVPVLVVPIPEDGRRDPRRVSPGRERIVSDGLIVCTRRTWPTRRSRFAWRRRFAGDLWINDRKIIEAHGSAGDVTADISRALTLSRAVSLFSGVPTVYRHETWEWKPLTPPDATGPDDSGVAVRLAEDAS